MRKLRNQMPNDAHELESFAVDGGYIEFKDQENQEKCMALINDLIATAHQQGVEAERKRIVENLFPDKKGDYKAWYDGDKLCVVNLNALTERETV